MVGRSVGKASLLQPVLGSKELWQKYSNEGTQGTVKKEKKTEPFILAASALWKKVSHCSRKKVSVSNMKTK